MKNTRGFIALISVLIISAMLLLVVVGGSFAGLYARANALDAELKERSRASADACADTVLARVAHDSAYAGGEQVGVGDDSCQIFATTLASSTTRIFVVQGISHHAYTTLQFSLDIRSLARSSWQELPTYP